MGDRGRAGPAAAPVVVRAVGQQTLDPLYMALSLLRRRKFTEAVELCTQMLERDPHDRGAWLIKTRALTEAVAMDETEMEDEGVAEQMLDDNTAADAPRPGTSFKRPLTTAGANPAVRPVSKAGRPVSGYLRPGTQATRPMTMDQALKTGRSGTAARPLTSSTGRSARLGTATVLAGSDPSTFIDPARLDLEKYAARPALGKALFRYLLHVSNDTLVAMDLAAQAVGVEKSGGGWWWRAMVGVCHYRLGMFRDAKRELEASFSSQPMVFTALLLGKVHVRLDQPLGALDCYTTALRAFPGSPELLAAAARVHEGVGDLKKSIEAYRAVLRADSTDAEAIASLAADHFYSDHPEAALPLYRRLLQAGAASPELFNNLALSCYYAQQYDSCLGYFERAVQLANDDETLADVWYNVSHVGVSLGDVRFAVQCLKLALTCNPRHAEAYNNLGALEHRQGNAAQARAHYTTATEHGEQLYEPRYNMALLCEAAGDAEGSHRAATAAVELFPEHAASRKMLAKLKKLFSVV